MQRRQFIRTSGAAAVLGLAGAWGCGEGEPVPEKAEPVGEPLGLDPSAVIGVQLYTLRDLLERDTESTLEQVADIGYENVETAGLYEVEPAAMRELLDRYGLASPAGHYDWERLRENPGEVFSVAQTLGQHHVVVPWLAPEDRTSVYDYQNFATRLNRVGAQARDAGLKLAYHNHEFEFETFGGVTPAYDVLVSETDPELVDFELDLYWVNKAGLEPLDYLRRYPGRFPLLHVKDSTAAPAREMVEVGAGVIDFAAILRVAGQYRLEHAFVEHDNPRDPIQSARAGYQHLRGLFG